MKQVEMSFENDEAKVDTKGVLDDLIQSYLALQKEEEALKEKKDRLKNSILNCCEDLGVNKYANEEASLTITDKTTYKYNDEVALAKALVEMGYGNFVVTKVDTSLNKILKISTSLKESLGAYVKESNSKALTVKEL